MKIQDWTTGGKSADIGGRPMQGKSKVRKVMEEFKARQLKSSSGQKVTNPKQAIAIGLSEAGLSRKKEGGEVKESKAMMKKEVAFMKSKGAPKSMVKHEESEMKGMKKGGKAYAKGGSVGVSSMGKVVSGGKRAHGEHSVQQKGHTRGKQIAMKKGGKC